MGITRPSHRESDRPYLHKSEIQEIDARCKSTQRGRCILRSPPSADKLKLKLKNRVEMPNNRTRYNVQFLKDKERMETFRRTLDNKYETVYDLLDEENIEVNPHWESLKKTRTSTCEEVMGKKNTQHKDLISVETINKLQGRK